MPTSDVPHRQRIPLLERMASAIVAVGRGIPGCRALLMSAPVRRAGYLVASAAGFVWGGILSTGSFAHENGVFVARGCPNWAFGRGGTTIGAVYLTRSTDSVSVLEHEAVHREQWRRYGLAFAVLYVAAGAEASTNRFEVEAGLEKGGYR